MPNFGGLIGARPGQVWDHQPAAMSKRELIFLRDIFWLTLSAFGGPQAHLALFYDVLVRKRGYLTEAELMEIYALCQVLPGPSSTQTITTVGYRRGGIKLALLTLAIWMAPAFLVVTGFAVLVVYLGQGTPVAESLRFARYIQPMAVGFVAHAGWRISTKLVTTRDGVLIMLASAGLAYFVRSPWVFPVLLLCAGLLTSFKYRYQQQEAKEPFHIRWRYFVIYVAIFISVATLGGLTRSLPVRLMENFYRNGSLIFGGGQVLVPVLYTEFVEFQKKRYLTSEEFLSGYAVVQALPGPVFSFASYVGGLSMRQHGPWGVVLGCMVAAVGINLPGTLMIFFVIQFWEQLKRYRRVRASLEGVNAASSGLVIAAAFLLLEPIGPDLASLGIVLATFCVLTFTKIPPPFIIAAGLLLGLVL